jgi:DNA-directed RNA polymerase subunit RPC12/RpoP
MSQEQSVNVFPEAAYACVRCGKKAGQRELEGLPSPRCSNCGFTVFSKSRPDLVKQVKSV